MITKRSQIITIRSTIPNVIPFLSITKYKPSIFIAVCSAPPSIPQAEIASRHSSIYTKPTVTYLCDEGYTRAGGSHTLTCQVADGVSSWNGENLICHGYVEMSKSLCLF